MSDLRYELAVDATHYYGDWHIWHVRHLKPVWRFCRFGKSGPADSGEADSLDAAIQKIHALEDRK